MLGPYVYRGNFGADVPGFESPVLSGSGLIVEGDLSNYGGLEISAFYMHKVFFREQNSRYIAEKVKMIYITMGYRRWFSENFSGGLSFYSSYPMGDGKVIYSDFPTYSVNTSARDATEYGFDFSLQWEFWREEKWALALDARYSLSVTQKDHEDADHYGLLLGLKYEIQEKGQPKTEKIKWPPKT